MPQRPTSLTAAAGEHYVAYLLLTVGYSVALPRAGTPGFDILVSDERGTKAVGLQVKTADWARRERKKNPKDSFWEWDVGARSRTLKGEDLLYMFVDLKGGVDARPDVFAVPSTFVAQRMDRDMKRYMFWIMEDEAPAFRDWWKPIEERLGPG